MASAENEMMDLLIQTPDSLSKADLEKLCDAISKDTLMTNKESCEDAENISEMKYPFVTLPIHSSGDAQPQDCYSAKSDDNLNITTSTPKSDSYCSSVLKCITSNTQNIQATGRNQLSFRPISVKIPSQAKSPWIPSLASGDGSHTFQYSTNYESAKKISILKPLMMENKPVDYQESSDVKGFNSKKDDSVFSVVRPYPLNEIGDDCLYGFRRMQVRFTVPCSEQAVATTTWLIENFEANLLMTVPRSAMYQEYINHFEKTSHLGYFNQAVFGKMVRACFPDLTTRRLGVRGQSRYHYAGLGVKATSKYANETFIIGKKPANGGQKKHNRDQHSIVAANVTVDGRQPVAKKEEAPKKPEKRKSPPKKRKSGTLVMDYPGMADLKLKPDVDQATLNSFLNFYVTYNKQFLSFITALDHDKTKEHLFNFSVLIPYDCTHWLTNPYFLDIIKVYDAILYQKATENLLPDCLASLPTDFKVSVRKFAKSFVPWISDVAPVCGIPTAVHDIRTAASVEWGDNIRRITTLCHVAKEARKALRDNGITKQLRTELETISTGEISMMCAWAGNDENMVGIYKVEDHRELVKREIQSVKKYTALFSGMLKVHSRLEEYVVVLDRLVDEEVSILNEKNPGINQDAVFKQFLMKWSAYTSKMLTEITLRTSASVGTFHLVSLLFGDYVNHVICNKLNMNVFKKNVAKIIENDGNIEQ